MLAFEVLVNGKRLCLVGTGTSDVVSTVVSWARRASDTVNFHVGGIVAGDSSEHFCWKTPNIDVGDEITIRLVDATACDSPECVYQPACNP